MLNRRNISIGHIEGYDKLSVAYNSYAQVLRVEEQKVHIFVKDIDPLKTDVGTPFTCASTAYKNVISRHLTFCCI